LENKGAEGGTVGSMLKIKKKNKSQGTTAFQADKAKDAFIIRYEKLSWRDESKVALSIEICIHTLHS
jgi:hypothetical protein